MFNTHASATTISRVGAVAVSLCVLGMLQADQPSKKLAAPIDKGFSWLHRPGRKLGCSPMVVLYQQEAQDSSVSQVMRSMKRR